MDWVRTLLSVATFACFTGQVANGESKVIQLIIPEELKPNTIISDVALEANVSVSPQMLHFELLHPRPREDSYFKMSLGKPFLMTAKRIDHEEICSHQARCRLRLVVVVYTHFFCKAIKFNVTILDINDNHPKFPVEEVSRSLLLSAPVGLSISIPAPDDPDSPRNGIEKYRIMPANGHFSLSLTRNKAGWVSPRLVLKKKFQHVGMYRVDVMVIGAGVVNKNATCTININIRKPSTRVVEMCSVTLRSHGSTNKTCSNVILAQHMAPVFEQESYTVHVRENVPPTSVILTVHATVPTDNIKYSFLPSLLPSPFTINPENGEIYLKSELDHETGSVYHLTVIAMPVDQDYVISGEADVLVYVEDVNDHKPEIKINTLTSTGMAVISEWTNSGRFVAYVFIDDGDSSLNGHSTCCLDDSNFRLDKLDDNEYLLVTAATFDREEQSKHNVSISCHDFGSPQRASVGYVPVIILDENDHYPKFINSPYIARIAENNRIGDSIIQITAQDPDLRANGFVLYKLDGVDDNKVEITKSGMIIAKTVFDYEREKKLSFEVIAYDLGIPSRSVSTTASIYIVNVNDERPFFAMVNCTFAVKETDPISTEVGHVRAIDYDAPPYNDFVYGLLGPSRDLFTIDPKNGTILTKTLLDRQKQTVHYLLATATDRGVAPLTGSVRVVVLIHRTRNHSHVTQVPRNKLPPGKTSIPKGTPPKTPKKKLSYYIVEQAQEDTDVFIPILVAGIALYVLLVSIAVFAYVWYRRRRLGQYLGPAAAKTIVYDPGHQV